MLKLYGFQRSNYYNIARMVLLEKEIAFAEVDTAPSQADAYLAKSPMGKVPCLETPHGFVSETSAITEYLEELHPQPALLPADAFARARVRELARECELYLDLAVRPCLMALVSGQQAGAEMQNNCKQNLARGCNALQRRAAFNPYLAGAEFSVADVWFYYCMQIAQYIAAEFNWDNPQAAMPGAAQLLRRISSRKSAQTIAARQQQQREG